MTAGQDALIEAMRIEQAKIYGQLCRESTAVSTPVCTSRIATDDAAARDSSVIDIRLARKRKGVA